MKFLLDQDVYAFTACFLSGLGYDVVPVAQFGLSQAADEYLLKVAQEQGRIFVTKALIGGTFHSLDAKHLQSYLDEFGFRFNRRHMLDRIFERCVVAMIECPIWTYWDIIGKPPILKKSRLKVA